MKTLRPLAFLAAALFALSACSAETKDDATSSANQLGLGLEGLTVVKGSVTANGSVKIAYQPEVYANIPATVVPYLAVKLVDSSEAAPNQAGVRPLFNRSQQVSIDVHGDFPGSPDVLVVDGDFHVLAQTKGVPSADGAHASLDVASLEGAEMILVRDMEWVRPMEFEVAVAQ